MELDNRMISAEWLKNRCYEICDEYNTEHLHIDRIIDEIDNAPDVEVVRCEKCRFFYRHTQIDTDRGDCWKYGISCLRVKKLDDFCSYGERRIE